MSPHLQQSIVALIDVSQRCDAARNLARQLGADDLLIFVRDPEIGVLLPAPGFLQTLPEGRLWRKFLAQCAPGAYYTADLSFPTGQSRVPATGIAAEDGSVLVLLGGKPDCAEVEAIGLQLPLLGAVFRNEQAVLSAAAQAQAAREAAEQARTLAEKLDATRSELHRALLAAETATRSKDEFLAVVSHELRTPLNAILGWAMLLRTGSLDQESTTHAIESIERGAKAQAQLIDDILDYSRIISGKLRLKVGPVELAGVIEASLDVIRPAAEAKGIRLQTILDPGVGPVAGDPDRLQQVMWNLLSNAVKFTPSNGRVQVRLERMNSHALITVSDSGQGIIAEFLPYVFERFRQADSTSTRRHGGLGLGLAITRHLVELHGGSIQAYSNSQGQGATFTVKLPLMIMHTPEYFPSDSPAQLGSAQDPLQSLDLPRLDGLQVLVVDDRADARDLLQVVLTHYGAKVTTAATAQEAFGLLQQLQPDVLVSDIEMPEEDGYSLIRKVRGLNKAEGGQIPAIALTAHARSSDRMRALAAGYQMHVPKPVEPSELVVVIANLLYHRRERIS